MPIDWLNPLADDAVKGYLADSRADRGLADKLRDAWAIRDKLRAATDEENSLVTEQAELEKGSRETRPFSRGDREEQAGRGLARQTYQATE